MNPNENEADLEIKSIKPKITKHQIGVSLYASVADRPLEQITDYLDDADTKITALIRKVNSVITNARKIEGFDRTWKEGITVNNHIEYFSAENINIIFVLLIEDFHKSYNSSSWKKSAFFKNGITNIEKIETAKTILLAYIDKYTVTSDSIFNFEG